MGARVKTCKLLDVFERVVVEEPDCHVLDLVWRFFSQIPRDFSVFLVPRLVDPDT